MKVIQELSAALHVVSTDAGKERHADRHPPAKHQKLLHGQLLRGVVPLLVHHLDMEESFCANASDNHAGSVHAAAARRHAGGLRQPPHHRLLGDTLNALQHVQVAGTILAVPATEKHHPTAVELVGVNRGEGGVCAAPWGVTKAVCGRPALALTAELPQILVEVPSLGRSPKHHSRHSIHRHSMSCPHSRCLAGDEQRRAPAPCPAHQLTLLFTIRIIFSL
mmetsp:Transcript_29874/g.84206  ORF Transcript_29874/g.84206 Transcript_29874/m.84206 type:complete len:221 (-) Transcript_29874:432-1094(-)